MAKNQMALKDDPALPAYVNPEQRGRGADLSAQNAPTPRIKVIQSNSGSDLRKTFGEGAIILAVGSEDAADNVLLHQTDGEPFVGITLHYHPSYEARNDVNDTASFMIHARTTDSESPLAMRCMKEDESRHERYGDSNRFLRRYDVMHNFILLIDSGPTAGKVGLLTYTGRYNRSAKNLNKLISGRADRGVSIYMNRVAFKSLLVKDPPKEWYVADHNNASPAFIPTERVGVCAKMHEHLEALYLAGKLNTTEPDDKKPVGAGVPVHEEDIPF